MRFRLDREGFTELPWGADPLHREVDSVRRAQQILAQVPLRDAAVATLRAEFAIDERTHPARVMRAEVVNRLEGTVGIEPEVAVAPPSCYSIVARSTAGLSKIRILVPSDRPAATGDPPLERADGASFVTTTRCVQAGDPPRLRFRIEAVAGAGYVMVRIYQQPRSN
jgi:hypothetical protein